MKNIKDAVVEIKDNIRAEEVERVIISDRGLQMKSGKCSCWIHGSKADTVMSFDKTHKRFKCFSCNSNYDIFDHYQQFKGLSFMDAIKAIVNDFNLSVDINIKSAERKPRKAPTKHDNNVSNVLNYIQKRSISKETCDYAGVKENGNLVVFEYRNEFGEHVANKYRVTKKTDKAKMFFEKETNVNTLWNMDKIDPSKPLVISEGEFDSLALMEAGYMNTVSVPTGCQSTEWVSVNWNWLEQFEEVILWFDNDEAGINGCKEIANRLPNDVVKTIKCSGEISDINELLHKKGKQVVLEILAMASVPSVDGVVQMHETEDFNPYEAESLKLGIPQVDRAIVGDLFGTLTILTGRNGHGKSTFLNQFHIAEPLTQGYKVFLFSGELRNAMSNSWLRETLANESNFATQTNKDGLEYKKITSTGKDYINDKLKGRFFTYEDGQSFHINAVLAKMELLAKREGVRVFILDNLMVLEDEEIDEYKAQANILNKLTEFKKKFNAKIVVVAHPKKTPNELVDKDDISGTAKVQNLVDYIESVDRIFNEDGSDKYTLFRILKNRITGKNVGKKLQFEYQRKRFYDEDYKDQYLNRNYLTMNEWQNEFEMVDGEF